MSALYWGILLLIAGSVLVTMTILANYTFPKPESFPTGREICQGDINERCAEEYELGPNTVGNNRWVDYFQRHDWVALGGIVALLLSIYFWSEIERENKREIERRDRRIQELEEMNDQLYERWHENIEEILAEYEENATNP